MILRNKKFSTTKNKKCPEQLQTLTGGGGTIGAPPKNDDVIYEQPLTEKDSELASEKVQRVSLFEKAGDEPLAQTDCSSDLPILRNRFHTSRGSSRISHVCNLSQATLASFVFMFFETLR